MSDKAFVSWRAFADGIYMMGESIDENEDIDHIIGIARGGLPGATMLSHLLDVPMNIVWATHYDGEERKEEVEVENYGLEKVKDGDTVLFFDDVVDTGKTMEKVVDRTRKNGVVDVDIWTASLHVKPDREYDPHYWVEETEQWVVYPWEADI